MSGKKKRQKQPKVRKTGSIPYGFHEGGRSEYLAQFGFSAFGTAVPVPRQEDSGVDLQCGLGERIGHRVLIRANYLVQVKSTKARIEYEDVDAVRWLLSQVDPLFIAVVDKREGTIEVFQTLSVVMQSTRSTPTKVTLWFNADGANQFSPMAGQELTIPLGLPILRFAIGDLADEAKRQTLRDVLAFWIELISENIQQGQYGVPLFQSPTGYQTNEAPKGQWTMAGNLATVSEDALNRLNNATYKTLATHMHLLAYKNERNRCIALRAGIGEALLDGAKLPDSWGLRSLAAAYYGTSSAFGLPNPLTIAGGGQPGTFEFSKVNVIPPKPQP